MKEYEIFLSVTPNCSRIRLRELCGMEELLLDPQGTRGVLRLINQIMIPPTEKGESPLKAERIAVSDRDRLLCEVFKFTYGAKIASTMNCRECGLPYDLDFNLEDLVSHTRRSSADSVDADPEGYFSFGKKHRFRLPNGEDELMVEGMNQGQAAHHLLRRCISPFTEEEMDHEEIEEMMESLGPVVMTSMAVNCPECGASQEVHFDIQSYLLAKLHNERFRVATEIHLIASAYQWSHDEILNLPRSLRQTYAGLLGMN